MCNDGLHLKNKKTKFQCTWDNIILNKGRENLAHDHDDYLKKKKREDVFGFLSITRDSSFLHKILIPSNMPRVNAIKEVKNPGPVKHKHRAYICYS